MRKPGSVWAELPLAEQLKAFGVACSFSPANSKPHTTRPGVVFTVLAALAGMEREYIRDRTLEGHERHGGQASSHAAG